MDFFNLPPSPDRELKYAVAIGACLLGVVFIVVMFVIEDRKRK